MHHSRLASGGHHSPTEWRNGVAIPDLAFVLQVGRRTLAPRLSLPAQPHQQRVRANSKLKVDGNSPATQQEAGFAKPSSSRAGEAGGRSLLRPSRLPRPRWLPAAGRDGKVETAGGVTKTREITVGPLMSAAPHTSSSVVERANALGATELRAETGKDPFTMPIPQSYETVKMMEQSAASVAAPAAAGEGSVRRGGVASEGVETPLDLSDSSTAAAGRCARRVLYCKLSALFSYVYTAI